MTRRILGRCTTRVRPRAFHAIPCSDRKDAVCCNNSWDVCAVTWSMYCAISRALRIITSAFIAPPATHARANDNTWYHSIPACVPFSFIVATNGQEERRRTHGTCILPRVLLLSTGCGHTCQWCSIHVLYQEKKNNQGTSETNGENETKKKEHRERERPKKKKRGHHLLGRVHLPDRWTFWEW